MSIKSGKHIFEVSNSKKSVETLRGRPQRVDEDLSVGRIDKDVMRRAAKQWVRENAIVIAQEIRTNLDKKVRRMLGKLIDQNNISDVPVARGYGPINVDIFEEIEAEFEDELMDVSMNFDVDVEKAIEEYVTSLAGLAGATFGGIEPEDRIDYVPSKGE